MALPDRPPPEAEPRLNRLALRIAALGAAGGAAAALGLLVAAVLVGTGPWVWLGVPAVGLAAGLATYAAVNALVARRLELARATLRQARKRRFDGLARLRADERRDDLDELLWQVYRAGRVLQQEIERLVELEDYRREFLGNVSHELKTPIFVISGFAEQLLDGALDDPAVNRRFVEKIGRNAERLNNLARDLLAISQIESGELQMTLAPFDLRGLAEEVIEAIEPVAEGRGVRLLLSVPAGLPPAFGDREQLRHVLTNLVDNGVKYNREGGRVEIAARRVEAGGRASLRVAVVDDGIGIPTEAQSRLTERFYRVDRSRSRRQGGTGLGLAIVKHVLEAHGQELRVESRPQYGSAFSFVLPVAEGVRAGRAAGPHASLSAAVAAVGGRGRPIQPSLEQ